MNRPFLWLALIAIFWLAACVRPREAPRPQAPVRAINSELTLAARTETTEPPPISEDAVYIPPGRAIRIGGSFPLTGPIPDTGQDLLNAAQLAVDDINAAGGIRGAKLELAPEDGACNRDAGTALAAGFAADPTILAVSGGGCSGETLGMQSILQSARIPFVSPFSTHPDVTNTQCDVCNRVILSDALQGSFDAIFFVDRLDVQRLAIIHDHSDYGLGLAEVTRHTFEARGGDIVDFEGVHVGDTDFAAALLTVAANQAQAVFFGGLASEAAGIKRHMAEIGLENIHFITGDAAFSQQFLDEAGAAAEGAYVSFPAGDEDVRRNEAFDAAYQEVYGVAPDELGPVHAQSYDSVLVIAHAIEAVAEETEDGGLRIDREQLIDAMRATRNLRGLTGSITCDTIGECGAGGVQVFQVQNGDWVQVAGFGLDE